MMMTYRPPLQVEEKLSGYRLVDADNRTIASASTYPWHGAPIEKQADFVRANFEKLAAVANARDSSKQ